MQDAVDPIGSGVAASASAQAVPNAAPQASIGTTALRANRFTPTPWHEVHGAQVRYKLPITLQTKIRAAITQFVPLTEQDSSPAK